jgi:hypothetical protein
MVGDWNAVTVGPMISSARIGAGAWSPDDRCRLQAALRDCMSQEYAMDGRDEGACRYSAQATA